MNKYPKGKTQEVTAAYVAAGGKYCRVFSERREKGRNGPYQRVKLYATRSEENFERAKTVFEAAGFTNVRKSGYYGGGRYYSAPSVTADFPL